MLASAWCSWCASWWLWLIIKPDQRLSVAKHTVTLLSSTLIGLDWLKNNLGGNFFLFFKICNENQSSLLDKIQSQDTGSRSYQPSNNGVRGNLNQQSDMSRLTNRDYLSFWRRNSSSVDPYHSEKYLQDYKNVFS